MAFANVNIGSTADDGSGDPLRTAFTKINLNFANIANGSAPLTAPVQTVAGRTGNIALTISDVSGAVPYGYVISGLIGANTYTNTAVANISTTVYNQISANLATNISNIIVAQVTANINSTTLAPVNANVTAANAQIARLDANLGVATTNISTLQTYVNTLQNNTATLFSNAVSQQSNINALQASITGANGAIINANTATTAYVNDQISSVTASWTANAVAQLAQITAANTAIVTANSSVVAYVNTLNSAMASNVSGANTAIVSANAALKSYTDTQISTANVTVRAYTDSQVFSANSAMGVYVDARDSAIVSAWTANAAVQAGNIATLTANAAAQSDAIAGANAAIVSANSSVVSYVNTLNVAMSSNIVAANLSIAGANAAIVSANTAMKSYVDANAVAQLSQIQGANSAIVSANTAMRNYVDQVNAADTQNWQSATELLTSQVTAANVRIQTLDANVGSFYTYANATFGISGYSNATVASYLPVYTGNISANHITPSGDPLTGFKPITAGLQSGYTVVPYYLAQFTTNTNSYSQINVQNISSGNQSTTDYVATANNGSDTTYFVDLGIAGNLYNGLNPNNSLGTVLNINDAYLYAQGNITSGSPGGNLVIGTVTPGTNIKFIAGGPNSANVAVTINNPGTNPVNNTSGALVVNGGMGVLGNINVGSYNYSLHTIRGNLLLGQGNAVASADSLLTLNATTDAPITNASALLHINGSTGAFAAVGVDSFGNTSASGISLRHARGTTVAPSAVRSGDRLGFFVVKGYGLSGYNASTGAGLNVYADENFNDSSTGVYATVTTIRNNSNVAVESLRIGSEGNVVIPASTTSANVNTGALVVKGGAGVAGNITIGGNVIAPNYLFANGVNILTTIVAGTYSNSNVASYLTANPQAGTYSNTNISAYLTTATISTTGNITAGNVLTNNHLFANGVNILTGVTYNYSNTNIAAYLTTATISTTGNITAGNVLTNNHLFANGVNILSSVPASSVTGTVATANVATYKVVTPLSNNQTYYIGFANVTTGNSTFNATTTVNVNPSTGNVSATAFVGSGQYLTGVVTSANPVFTGNMYQQGSYYETYSNVSNTGGNLTLNFVNGGVYYATLTANVTANIINISNTAFTTTGFTVIVDQGATPYRIANIQFAGGTVSNIKWVGASVPTGTASNTDVISISLINLNNGAYRILGQQSNYA
jgi:hypothetical protein